MNINLQTINISGPESTVLVKKNLKNIAAEIGFQLEDIEVLLIVVTELSTNIIKFASQGLITFCPIKDIKGRGIEIKAIDRGPGIANIERAMADGFSSGDSLGFGLGAINRGVHDLKIVSPVSDSGGTEISCKRWINPATTSMTAQLEIDTSKNSTADALPASHVMKVGYATRKHPKMQVNGDAAYISQTKTSTTLGVIDGIGHGELARRATSETIEYLDSHTELTIDDLVKGANTAIRQTRGVVMSLARFEINNDYFQHTGIGNILTRIHSNGKFTNLVTRRGIIGGSFLAPPLLAEHAFRPGDLLIFQSDGLKTHWDFRDFPWLKALPVDKMANELLELLNHDNDDATIQIARLEQAS